MSPDPAPLSGRQPKAVRSALAVLEEVVAAGPGVTAKEISGALKLPPATTYRLLNLLVAEGYLVRLPDLRGFALGRRAARLSVPVTTRPPAAARAIVGHLRQQVRWGVHLASFRTGRIVLLDGDPDHPPHDEALLARYPHASALGKLLLADQADWRAAVRGLRQLTAHTVIDADRLDAELARCREDRLARQCGELHADRGCLAVPIHDVTDGTLVAGLALSGPPDRVAEPNTELLDRLREHAAQLAPLLA
ncbi:MAG TPA: IclR family transcriptional regulator C-terminal domain-containing protein [Amycolatopsis sp.]|uniref:IclR family transcriptional regulator C-terminal domain-containing protein n=1 Tax=Amycolatopsis nalaikhensis TaxID=715472 RepID=A0ABY8XII0_9PSEU|nr:IclR family transcriptional regulator C-terminal domain-containing protein [Amycolatopsis sp. 2-2]WIV55446.1 IclR family transcriptional regulator C-terminal domain-containing protein [Amycolatopsis sp. 2-2]